MQVLFLTPYFNQPRGNSTTIRRLVNLLQKEEVSASVIPYLEKDDWNRPSPDILHILHATRFFSWAQQNKFVIDTPYLVTMGGTDINMDLTSEINQGIFDFLDQAHFITVFTEDSKKQVHTINPNWEDKTFVIPQSVWLPWSVRELTEPLSPKILLPAGVRPVKDVLNVLPALDLLIEMYPDLKFTILGANLDENEFARVKEAEKLRPWLLYAGVVPFEIMKTWYEQAEIIINTSISEGQSLAVMEAMAIGRPVIARKNAANISLIKHEQTGWLYETTDEFVDAVHSIMNNHGLLASVKVLAKQSIKTQYSPEKELRSYLELYKKMMESEPK